MAVFGSDGNFDRSRCHAAVIKGYGRSVSVTPTHAVLFRSLFTGFTPTIKNCMCSGPAQGRRGFAAL